ncbi:unnamed protein product [Penicillium egyptiacum]|uniref:Period circadian protein n=1 Tax=Penicillium egyptiacum TaxID=1303716 RepID=A0A9W4KRV7_9EURO|nr:unnamed protein product [Penicillium egyptiacum]
MQFVRKAEEAITGKKDESHESTKSSNHGPHKSNLANKLDPRVDSDKDNRAAYADVTGAVPGTTHGTTAATGTGSSTLGYGTTQGTSGATGTCAGVESTQGTSDSTIVGPHSSNIADKANPRVDSDRENCARHEAGLTGAGTGTSLGSTHRTTTTATGTHGSALSSGTAHGMTGTTAGPHSSNIANKADPRVDSDRDNRAYHEGLTGAGTGAGVGSTHSTTATGTHSSTLGSGTGATHGAPIATPDSSSTNAGPHSSNIANKLDPRVDSDRDDRAQHEGLTGAGTAASVESTHGTTGITTAGPYSSNIANKLDRRVDSDRDSRAQHQSTLAGTGPGTTTHGTHTRGATVAPTGLAISGSGLDTGALAGSSYDTPANTPATGTTTSATGTTGPHRSSIANKLDPRVDSDATRAQNEGPHRKI